jgi:pyruvate,water dikinase
MIYEIGGTKLTKNVQVPESEQRKYAINDEEILQLARWACIIEDHYSEVRGQYTPMIPFCRTPDEGRKVLAEMEKHGLKRGENDLQVYVMCEIPSNVILADQFSEVFDGFSIGSNDLTQLTLGLDRDSALVAHIFDERNEGVKEMVRMVIEKAKKNNRKIGICGQAPSDYPEFAKFLVELGIDSISLNPDSLMKTLLMVAEVEGTQG